jgi:hypothetical protein
MPQTWLLQDISKIKQTQATVQSRDAVHSKATKQTDSPGTFYLSRPNGFLNPQEEERFQVIRSHPLPLLTFHVALSSRIKSI